MSFDPEYAKLQLKELRSLVRNNPKEKTLETREAIKRIERQLKTF
jgi:hypothetical protein